MDDADRRPVADRGSWIEHEAALERFMQPIALLRWIVHARAGDQAAWSRNDGIDISGARIVTTRPLLVATYRYQHVPGIPFQVEKQHGHHVDRKLGYRFDQREGLKSRS